jgi:hypothetical protein
MPEPPPHLAPATPPTAPRRRSARASSSAPPASPTGATSSTSTTPTRPSAPSLDTRSLDPARRRRPCARTSSRETGSPSPPPDRTAPSCRPPNSIRSPADPDQPVRDPLALRRRRLREPLALLRPGTVRGDRRRPAASDPRADSTTSHTWASVAPARASAAAKSSASHPSAAARSARRRRHAHAR